MNNDFDFASNIFGFLFERFLNKYGILILYFFGSLISYYITKNANAPWWIFIIGSIVWTIACGAGFLMLSFSASIADFVSYKILEAFVSKADANKASHRFGHALIASFMCAAIFSMILLNWFGYIDDGCNGETFRC